MVVGEQLVGERVRLQRRFEARELGWTGDRLAALEEREELIEEPPRLLRLVGGVTRHVERVVARRAREEGGQADAQRGARAQLGDGIGHAIESRVASGQGQVAQPDGVAIAGAAGVGASATRATEDLSQPVRNVRDEPPLDRLEVHLVLGEALPGRGW